jgi:3-oxoacyl-[acyl-carrier protein] reductase
MEVKQSYEVDFRQSFDFTGKTALVTGATGGMGRGIAAALAMCGADLMLQSTDDAAGSSLARELADSSSGRVHAAKADIADLDQGAALVERALSDFGQVDFLVNNSGVLGLYDIVDMSVADWDRTIAINLRGTVFLTQQVIRSMSERRSGSIVNIGSSLSASGGAGPEGVDYNISKAGLECFTKTLARQLAPHGIRANSVSPGIIDTPMLRGPFPDEAVAGFVDVIPLGRLGTPDDIGAATCFLLSDAASYITGQALHVNGGARMVS